MSNCSPKKEKKEATATFTYTPPPVGDVVQQPVTLSFTYVDKYWHEVRPPSNTNKSITNGKKKPKTRKTYIAVPDGETADGEVTFTNKEYIQQIYEYDDATGVSKPVYERQCIADISYDEKYFYHIFEWPSTHTLDPRPAGGFTATTTTSTTAGEGGAATTTSTTTYAVESINVSGSFNLAKVESQITGLPEGSIAYHGGTDDNKIFFTYTSNSSDVVGVGNIINGWTVNKVVNYSTIYSGSDQEYRITKKIRKRVSKTSKKNESPSFIYINSNSASSQVGVIAIGDQVNGKGIAKGTTVTNVEGNKITLSKPLIERKRVKEALFKKTTVANKINETTLCYAEISGGSANFVADALYSIDSSSGSQSSAGSITHRFNDNTNKNIETTVTGPVTIVPQSLDDPGGRNDSLNRKHYLVTFTDSTVINNINDISIQINQNLTASGVSRTFTVTKLELVNNKSFRIWFTSQGNDPNNSFVRSFTVLVGGTVGNIKVIAGKGIISRSAVVGSYISIDKKEFRYTPLFYSQDNQCAPTILSDEYSEYVLGDIILGDGTELLTSKPLVTRPISNLAYNINNIYWTNYNRPVDQDSLKYWISKFDSNILVLENQIISSEDSKLNGRKVSRAVDSECGNNLYQEYTKVYYPNQEIQAFNDSISPFQQEVSQDPCVDVKAPGAYTKEEISNIITSNISGLTSLSAIKLPDEMYKQIVSNTDSLQNMLLSALDTIGASVPTKTTIPNIFPQIEGDNKSTQIFSTEEVTRIPPKFKSLEYLIEDLSFFSDIELTPSASGNIFNFTISSIPRWTGSASVGGTTGDDISPAGSGLRILTNKTNGYVDSITVSAVSFNADSSTANPLFPLNPTTVTKTWVGGSPYPTNIWHGSGVNYQQDYEKTFEFRINEVTEYVTESVRTKGSPFVDAAVYTQLSSALGSSDTTINVTSTEGFLSSGYIIIPKFIIKEEKNPETKNVTKNHYYLGEEIIYYRKKTETQFLNCTRGMFDSTSTFDISVNSGKIEKGVTYIIKSLGSVNWQDYGASSNASVGTIFTSTKDGSQTTESGEVTLFESTLTAFESAPDVNAVSHSYEKRGYLTQFWPIKIQNKAV